MTSRRRFFLSSAAMAIAAGVPVSASAFRRVDPTPEAQRGYQAACSSSRYHEDLIDQVVQNLEKQGMEIGESDVRNLLAARTCPWCGCSVATRTRPTPESGERPAGTDS
ncbi:hypothetical protein [Rhodovibrio salinarum]|uniref:Uncharacterized protein n=1 Tax=Rhodovibrio salinarum TaxID=1087 RepID=A0A934UZC4_9PROT|nr:hypothetical protein [Rhodovibrio salinarum]MBK1696583.1 hypothetical protein [Rhodovibrio salinarum]